MARRPTPSTLVIVPRMILRPRTVRVALVSDLASAEKQCDAMDVELVLNPEYVLEESRFVLESVLLDSFRKARHRGGPGSVPELYAIESDHQIATIRRLHALLADVQAGHLGAICQVVRSLGLETPREPEPPFPVCADGPEFPIPAHARLDAGVRPWTTRRALESGIRSVACAQVNRWRREAQAGSVTVRALARQHLRAVERACAQKQRGRPTKRTAHPREILVSYFREVFRFRQVFTVLRHWPGTPSGSVRVARELYDLDGLAVEVQLEIDGFFAPFGFLADGELVHKAAQPPPRPENLAALVTTRRFRLADERHLENLVSGYRVMQPSACFHTRLST